MRLIKMLGLAAVAALAAMAFVANSASAGMLCEENKSPCPEAQRVADGAILVGLANELSAVLLNGSKEALLKCNSKTTGKVTKNNKEPVLGEILSLTFTGCKGSCTSATGVNLPYKMEGFFSPHHAIISPISGPLGATIKGCPFGVECKYTTATEKILLGISGDTLVANEVPLSLQNPGLCELFAGVKGAWDASYLLELENGKAVFLVEK